MMLSELLSILAAEAAECGSYESAVFCRSRTDDGAYSSEAESFPIIGIAVDEADREINLMCTQAVESPAAEDPVSLSVEAVTSRLAALEPNCSQWSVYSGSSTTPLNAEWGLRFDVPIVGIAVNRSEGIVAFLQWPLEQWRPAA